VVNLQGDLPAIAPESLKRVVAALAESGCDIATLAAPITDPSDRDNPNVVKPAIAWDEGKGLGRALYFSRAPVPYARDAFARGIRKVPPRLPVYRHLGIYAYRAAFLKTFTRLEPVAIERAEALEQLRALAYGHRIAVTVTRRSPHPGVDTPADLRRARSALA